MSYLFMSEEEIFAGPFYLVSYSHRDMDAVREDINSLINVGARIWIDHRGEEDENMFYGDNWKSKINTALNHKNCIGALIYVSPYSLAGKATQWEQEQIFSKTDFKHYLISVNTENKESGTTVKRHYKLATNLCDEDDSPEPKFINPDYNYGIKPKQEKWINPLNEEIFINRLDSENCVKELKKICLADGVISNTAKTVNEINQSAKKAYDGLISFGLCKDKEAINVSPDSKEKEGIFQRGRDFYICIDKKTYFTKPLTWRLLYTKREDDTKVFICCEVVDVCQGNRLDDFLQRFKSIAFTDEERSLIGNLRIPVINDFEMTENDLDELLRLSKEQRSCSWWLDDEGLFSAWKRLYKNNMPYGLGAIVTQNKGVRPVLEIKTTEFNKLMELIKER